MFNIYWRNHMDGKRVLFYPVSKEMPCDTLRKAESILAAAEKRLNVSKRFIIVQEN